MDNEKEILDKRVRIIRLQEISAELDNLNERLKETINTDVERKAITKGFERTMEDAKQIINLLLTLEETSLNTQHKREVLEVKSEL